MKGKPKNSKKPNLHLKLYSCNEDKCNEHYIREEDAENEKPKPLQLPDVSKKSICYRSALSSGFAKVIVQTKMKFDFQSLLYLFGKAPRALLKLKYDLAF